MVLDMAEHKLNILFVVLHEAACVVVIRTLGCSSWATRATAISSIGNVSRPHTQMDVAGWPEIVAVELFFERLDVMLVRIVAEMILAVQMLNEISDALDHASWRDLVNVVFQRLANLF